MKTEVQLHIDVHGFGMECSASSYGCDGHIVVHIVFSHKVDHQQAMLTNQAPGHYGP